jgi:hypothetical protein
MWISLPSEKILFGWGDGPEERWLVVVYGMVRYGRDVGEGAYLDVYHDSRV